MNIYIACDEVNDYEFKIELLKWNSNFRCSFYTDIISKLIPKRDFKISHTLFTPTDTLAEAEICLIIIGENSCQCKKQLQLIEKAQQFNLKIVAVKTHAHNQLPRELNILKVSWALSFTIESIESAIKQIV